MTASRFTTKPIALLDHHSNDNNQRDSEAKKLLQKALIDGEIPTDTKEMGPRAVYDKCKNRPEFLGMEYNSTFTRRLRDLRKQEIHVDDVKDVQVDWANSTAKQFLKDCIIDGTMPLDYSENMGAQQVWELHCKDNPAFVGMHYNSNFTKRLS
jgi:hypothetical protein